MISDFYEYLGLTKMTYSLIVWLKPWFYKFKNRNADNRAKIAKQTTAASSSNAREIKGIPNIINESIAILEGATNELYIKTFLLRFGIPHEKNEIVRALYQGSNGRKNLSVAIEDFNRLLKLKLLSASKVGLVTLNSKRIKGCFLRQLREKAGYSYLKDEAEIAAIIRKERELRKFAKRELTTAGLSLEKYLTEVSEMSEQYIIADISMNGSGIKYSCLFFQIGTSRDGEEWQKTTGEEKGVYTEDQTLIRHFIGQMP